MFILGNWKEDTVSGNVKNFMRIRISFVVLLLLLILEAMG